MGKHQHHCPQQNSVFVGGLSFAGTVSSADSTFDTGSEKVYTSLLVQINDISLYKTVDCFLCDIVTFYSIHNPTILKIGQKHKLFIIRSHYF